ncbi:hypothetical protein [Patulibacter defluvii]|uniref:hypothetical protein n=1 Tax=Patulibacter defluvii TaxID=3095358 RepID=UPI002A7507C3|nr:hypothetical protein [Patulibacter sp. DM4]
MTETPSPSPVPPTLRWRLDGDQAAAVEQLLERAAAERVVERLWERDPTLWGPAGQPEVADRLGWLDAPTTGLEQREALETLAAEVVADGFTDVILAGMGGSSLAPEVIWRWSHHRAGDDHRPHLHLRLLDSTDPDAVATADAATEAERTLVLVSTKSGGTVETLSLFRHFWERHPHGDAFVAVTDPGSGLERLAREHGFRAILHGDPEIGGRYSALSPFGTVPAALVGADLEHLLGGGQAALDGARMPLADNAAVRLGVALAALAAGGRDKLALRVEDPRLAWFGLWLEQLVAESTGKHGHGLLPVIDEARSGGGTLGPDRQLLVLRAADPPGGPDPTLEDELAAAAAAGVPVLELTVDGPGALGAAFAAAEVAVAIAGWGLGINPFDQPDVQAAKDATQAVLAEIAAGQAVPEAPEADAGSILGLLDGLTAPGYLAILAYLPPSDGAAEAVDRLRAALAARTDAAVTAGFGPRYLHSTGQLHKGGPPGGRFLLLEHDPRAAVSIPGADYDFGTLFRAQSAGDLRTLVGRDRQALRVDLGSDWPEGLDALVTAIEEHR